MTLNTTISEEQSKTTPAGSPAVTVNIIDPAGHVSKESLPLMRGDSGIVWVSHDQEKATIVFNELSPFEGGEIFPVPPGGNCPSGKVRSEAKPGRYKYTVVTPLSAHDPEVIIR